MTETKRIFETGAIRDLEAGKPDLVEGISWVALWRFAEYMTAKKEKYGHGNFKKGIPIDSYERSMARHMATYFANKYEGMGREPQEDHLAGIVFNALGIMLEEEKKK